MTLSIIIPAFNESLRLPPYLQSIRQYSAERFGTDYEVIVVDDGSSDDLPDKLNSLARDWPQLQTANHPENMGKGAAVRTGILAAAGDLILFADADGATPIEEEHRLRLAIEGGADVAVGSRLVDAEGVVRQRTPGRALIGRAFARLARGVLAVPVRDSQCGFKMFRQQAGKHLFRLSREHGYLFDLEILMMAQKFGYEIAEVPINWSDQPGSRLNMRREGRKILTGLWRVRRRLAALAQQTEPP